MQGKEGIKRVQGTMPTTPIAARSRSVLSPTRGQIGRFSLRV